MVSTPKHKHKCVLVEELRVDPQAYLYLFYLDDLYSHPRRQDFQVWVPSRLRSKHGREPISPTGWIKINHKVKLFCSLYLRLLSQPPWLLPHASTLSLYFKIFIPQASGHETKEPQRINVGLCSSMFVFVVKTHFKQTIVSSNMTYQGGVGVYSCLEHALWDINII